MNFNIGDKVRRRDGAGSWNNLRPGDVGVVTGYGLTDSIIVDNQLGGHNRENLELVKKTNTNVEIY